MQSHPSIQPAVLISALMFACLGCGESQPPEDVDSTGITKNDVPPASEGTSESRRRVVTPSRSSLTASLALTLAQSILNDVDDESAYEQHQDKIRQGIPSLQTALSRLDDRLAQKISQLQRKLDDKTSIDDIRKAIAEVATAVESEIEHNDDTITPTETEIAELIDVIGYFPTVTPSPLLRVNTDGKPEAHLLTVKWADLLSRTHVHWVEMEELNRIWKPNSPEMKEAMERHARLLKETQRFRRQVSIALADELVKRTTLLRTRRINHPDIREFDARIASLTWLVRIAWEEEKDPRYAGMLVVAEDLVGPAASDIIATFELAGTDLAGMIPLYRKLTHIMPAADKDDLQDFRSTTMQKLQSEILTLELRTNKTHKDAIETKSRLSDELRTKSNLSKEVKTLITRKRSLIVDIQQINQDSSRLVDEVLAQYLQNLKRLRLNHPEQLRCARRLILPLVEIYKHTKCYDWSNRESAELTWNTFLSADRYVAAPDTYANHLVEMDRQRLEAEQQRLEAERREERRLKDEAERQRLAMIAKENARRAKEAAEAARMKELAENAKKRKEEQERNRKIDARKIRELLLSKRLAPSRQAVQIMKKSVVLPAEIVDKDVTAALRQLLYDSCEVMNTTSGTDLNIQADTFDALRIVAELPPSHSSLQKDLCRILRAATHNWADRGRVAREQSSRDVIMEILLKLPTPSPDVYDGVLAAATDFHDFDDKMCRFIYSQKGRTSEFDALILRGIKDENVQAIEFCGEVSPAFEDALSPLSLLAAGTRNNVSTRVAAEKAFKKIVERLADKKGKRKKGKR